MTTRSTRSPRRRTVIALGVVLAILAVFVVRLVDIQVVNAKENISDSMAFGLSASQTLTGTRGSIVDSSGQTLAVSSLDYDCQFTPVNVGAVSRLGADGKAVKVPWEQVADEIATITGKTGDEVRAIVSEALAKDKGSQYALLGRGYTTEQYRKLMELGTDFIACTAVPSRTYPNGAVGGNLLGFTYGDGKLAGLEQAENQCLAAKNGTLQFQKGKDGVIIPGTEVETPAVDGGTVKLTIDLDLQWYLQQLAAQAKQDMGAKFATITVVEVKTGKIKAAAEYPTVDPNNYDAPGSYLNSRIFGGTFEPGSTFKGLTASTLIDAAGQTPTSTAQVPSTVTFPNGAKVRDSFVHPTYDYTLAGVLIDSSNAGASVFSQRVSPTIRYDYFQKFGIGSGSAVGFPGEAKGVVHPVKNWDNQMLYDTSYGQGVTTTVPELMEAYDGIINNGVRVPLSLVESCTRSDGTVVTPDQPKATRVVSKKTSADMREIFENVALQASYANLVKIPGYRIGTKTGTGQISNNGHGYKAGVYYTTMIGFAPANDPQYLVAVTLDEPTKITSSTANAPYFQKAMTQVLKTFRVMPSTSQPTILPKFG
jgi:cell division protein FtsI (penicillin-binding protein 3)